MQHIFYATEKQLQMLQMNNTFQPFCKDANDNLLPMFSFSSYVENRLLVN